MGTCGPVLWLRQIQHAPKLIPFSSFQVGLYNVLFLMASPFFSHSFLNGCGNVCSWNLLFFYVSVFKWKTWGEAREYWLKLVLIFSYWGQHDLLVTDCTCCSESTADMIGVVCSELHSDIWQRLTLFSTLSLIIVHWIIMVWLPKPHCPCTLINHQLTQYSLKWPRVWVCPSDCSWIWTVEPALTVLLFRPSLQHELGSYTLGFPRHRIWPFYA